MYKLLLALHLLFAVFAIGPLAGLATTAGRALRHNDAAAAAGAARGLRVYAGASVLVVLAGFALMSVDSPSRPGEKVAEFSDVWIWLSLLLWLVVIGLVLALIVPALQRAAAGETAARTRGELGKVAAAGGGVGLLIAVIVVLMVYRPGS